MLFQDSKDSKKDTGKTVTEKKVPLFKFPSDKTVTEFITSLNPITQISQIVSSNFGAGFMTNLNNDIKVMEEAVSGLAGKFGGMREFAMEIKSSIDAATPSVIALGGTIEDVVAMQEGAIKALNRQVILDKEAYADLYAVGNLIGDGTEATSVSTAKLVGEFKDAGVGLYQVSKQMGDIIKDARDIGAASAAVYEQLSANIKSVNLYNFSEGVRGMGKMAAEAAVLRLNMSDVLNVAEKVFNPEDAIQMAADMQRLGVQVTDLLDPYKLMDMGRNKPEELQADIYKAAAALTYFDEKNQKISILPGEQGRLRELAKAFGMTAAEFSKIAVNYGDMEMKMKAIKFNPFVTEEKDQKFLASLSELKDGKYMVNIGMDPKTNEAIMRPIESLGKIEIDRLKRAEADKQKSPSELIVEANNKLVNIHNALLSMQGIAPRKLAASQTMENFQQKTSEIYLPIIKGTREAMGVQEKPGGYLDQSKIGTDINKAFGSLATKISDAKNVEDIQNALKHVGKNISELGKEYLVRFKNIPEYATEASKKMKDKGESGMAYDFTEWGTKLSTTIATTSTEILNFWKKFENPGTLKVTIYGEKIGLIPLIAEGMKLALPDEYVKYKDEEKKSEEEKKTTKKENKDIVTIPAAPLTASKIEIPKEKTTETKKETAVTIPAAPLTASKIEIPKEKMVETVGKKDATTPETKKETLSTKTTPPSSNKQYLIDIVQSTKDKNDNLYNWKEVRDAWQKEHSDKKEGSLDQNLELLSAWKKGWKPEQTEKTETKVKQESTGNKFINLEDLKLKTPGIIPEIKIPTAESKVSETFKTILDATKGFDMSGLKIPTAESKVSETTKKEIGGTDKSVEKFSTFTNTLNDLEKKYFTTTLPSLSDINLKTPGIVPEIKSTEVVKTTPEKTIENNRFDKESIFSKISEIVSPKTETPKIEYPKTFDLSLIKNLTSKDTETKTVETTNEKYSTMKEALTDSKKTYEKIESVMKPMASNLTLDLKTLLPKSLSMGGEKTTDFSNITKGLNSMVENIRKETKLPTFTKITETTSIPKEKTTAETKAEKIVGFTPGMKSEDILKQIMPYLEKSGTLTGINEMVKKERDKGVIPESKITPKTKTESVTNKEYNETKLKTISETIARTQVAPKMPSQSFVVPRTMMRDEIKTKTREGVTDKIDVTVVVKGEFPNDLQPIWNQALRNTQWMENLQRTISASIIEKNALRGTGNYSKPFLT
jgi:hypothetical protein